MTYSTSWGANSGGFAVDAGMRVSRVQPAVLTPYAGYYESGRQRHGGDPNAGYRFGFDRLARFAAAGLAGFVRSAGALQRSAAAVIGPEPQQLLGKQGAAGAGIRGRADNDTFARRVRQMVDDYNRTLDGLSDSGGFFRTTIRRGLAEASDVSEAAAAAGIRRSGDGRLTLDEELLREALDSAGPASGQAREAAAGLARRLRDVAERLTGVPAGALLNQAAHGFGSLTAYRPTRDMYWQVQPAGLLFNDYF